MLLPTGFPWANSLPQSVGLFLLLDFAFELAVEEGDVLLALSLQPGLQRSSQATEQAEGGAACGV